MEQLIRNMKIILQDTISYGIFTDRINEKNILYYLEKVESFDLWKNILVSDSMIRLEGFKTQTRYLPWLIVLRNSMIQIEREQKLINDDLAFKTKCIMQIISWLNHPSKYGIIKWIIEFLFREEFVETKRKFLFMKGPPSTGKTFFIDLLLHSKMLLKKYMSMNYYAAQKKGDYKLHALIFDDPGKASSAREGNLAAEFFLNASKTGGESGTMHFPIKYGFMNVSHGQIVFISNYGVDQMFPKASLPAIKTRLWELDFDLEGNNGPFPLVCPTSQSRPFVFDLLTKHEMVNVKTSLDHIQQLVDQDEIQQEQNEIRREQQQDLLTDSEAAGEARAVYDRFEEDQQEEFNSPNFYSPCRFLFEEEVPRDGDEFWDLMQQQQQQENENEEIMFGVPEEEEDGKRTIYLFIVLVFPVIIEDERLNPENMYYFLWYAILLMIQTSLPRQSEETLRFLIPNLEF